VAKKTTYRKLGQKDLYVIAGDLEGGEEVKQKFLAFSRIFNVDPGFCSGVITTMDDVEVILVHRRRFCEVAEWHMCAPVSPKGTPVVVSISTLYEKVADGAGRLLNNFENPCETEIFTGDEEVIDFGDAFKAKVVVKIELDLKKEYGDEI